MTNSGWTDNHTKLREILTQLYLERASAQRIAVDAGLNPSHITFSDNASNNWHEIINKAMNQGLLIRLIERASAENQRNEALKEALAVFKTGGKLSDPGGGAPVDLKPISDPQLRDFIKQYINRDDIADLLQDLTVTLQEAGKLSADSTISIDTFSSPSATIGTIAREMVEFFRRRTWTPFLVVAVKAAHPDAFQQKFGA